MRSIAIINQKGGVGKTTTVANLAHALALAGKKTLMIDLDPQAHLTASYGVNSHQVSGVDLVILEQKKLTDYATEVRSNLYLVPAGNRMAEVEHSGKGGELLRSALVDVGDWDFILLDCPPSSGLLVTMAMYATNEVLIPVTGDYLGLQGLSHLMATLKNFEEKLGHQLQHWIVLTRFHTRRRLAREVQSKLISYFPNAVLKTPIREIAALASSPSFGQSIFEYDKRSKGAEDYQALAKDLLKRRTMS